jgi:hypothetical protein
MLLRKFAILALAASPASLVRSSCLFGQAFSAPAAAGNNAPVLLPPPPSEVTLGMPRWRSGPPSATWASDPIRIAVLDFAYIAPDGLSSKDKDLTRFPATGTSVADLIAEQLQHDTRLEVVRMDFDSIPGDRSDPVQTGKGPDVDAVLVGELIETDAPPLSPLEHITFRKPVPALHLRARLIDARSGALLLTMEADGCSGGSSGDCPAAGFRQARTFRLQAADLNALAASRVGLAAKSLIAPMENPSGVAAAQAGRIMRVSGNILTIALSVGSGVKAGDTLTVYSSGLTKNPATGTLSEARGQQVGVVQIAGADGVEATGTFIGSLVPAIGDSVKLSANN